VAEPGDGFTVAEVTLPDERPVPGYAQPKFNMRPFAYFLEDWLGPALMIPKYRQMVRQQWGAQMAPVSARTRLWLVAVLAAGIVGWVLGSERKATESSK
jgi:hypothetical protein